MSDSDSPVSLPLDVLLDVLVLLPLRSILVLRQTCKSFSQITRSRTLWVRLFRRHVLDRHIPYPHLPLADLSVSQLESLTHRALAIHTNWSSSHPVPRRTLIFAEHSAHVIFLQFLPARANRWLISVRTTGRPRRYLLQCWDVSLNQPRCVAQLVHADGPYGGVVLNDDPNNPAVLALQSAQTEMFSIHFDAHDPESAFETESVIDGIRELHLLSGNTLVTRDINDGGTLRLWDLDDLAQEKLQILNPSLMQPNDRIQAVHLAYDYALVVRLQSIEIYSTTPRPGILPVHGGSIAYPLAQFKLPWHTDTVVLAEQGAPSNYLPRPLHLLVRFASIFPWPVNVLHRYVLHPNPTYHLGPIGRSAHHTPSTSPTTPSSSHPSSHSHSHAPSSPPTLTRFTPPTPCTTESNLPYVLPPSLIHTIGSPVRLFAHSAIALGQYGTALWLDNHTEDWSSGPSERGQRLAGQIIRPSTRNDESDRRRSTDGDEDRSRDGHAAVMRGLSANTHGNDDDDDHHDNDGNDDDGNGNAGIRVRGLVKPAVPEGVSESCGASIVFGVREDDAWTRVAMDEAAGRIAIGHVDGTITLFEY